MTIENRGFNQFWVDKDGIKYAVGVAEAARLLECSIDEVRKVTFATVELSEVTQ